MTLQQSDIAVFKALRTSAGAIASEELPQITGYTRTSVNRSLARLKKAGIVSELPQEAPRYELSPASHESVLGAAMAGAPAEVANGAKWKEVGGKTTSPEVLKRRNCIRIYLKRNPDATRAQICKALKLTEVVTANDLNVLRHAGLVTFTLASGHKTLRHWSVVA